jgi:polysaccharide export outer membrane protein
MQFKLRSRKMKRTICVGFIGLLVFLISTSIVCSQTEKEIVLKKQVQAEVAADSDQYVIGPEDVLYIHVWREDALTRTVPVRMDGNISLPIIQEIKASGLTPLQ